MNQMHIVDFATYCKTCSYQKNKETDEPCNECLTIPARANSSRPEKWKENKNG